MDISGTSLHYAYVGHYLSSTQSKSPQAHQSGSVDFIDPVSTSRKIKEDNNSAYNSHYSKKSESEQESTYSNLKTASGKNATDPRAQLSAEEQKVVQELKQRDQEVRAHEAAHLAAAGKLAASGASYKYQRGPDGKNYAVGGEVKIDTSPVPNDPQATIQKARQIKAAAQAPANPSPADRQVAASAAQMEAKARQEVYDHGHAENEVSHITSENSNFQQVGKSDSESANRLANHTAASAYRAIDETSRSDNNTLTPIELVA